MEEWGRGFFLAKGGPFFGGFLSPLPVGYSGFNESEATCQRERTTEMKGERRVQIAPRAKHKGPFQNRPRYVDKKDKTADHTQSSNRIFNPKACFSGKGNSGSFR